LTRTLLTCREVLIDLRLVLDLGVRLCPTLAHRIALHLNAMRVVDQAVEDAVCQRGIADRLVPARDRQLRGEDRRTHLVAIFANLPEVAALGF